MRESIAAKSVQYLGEARLTIEHVDAGAVRASCRGDGAVYAIAWSRDVGWSCSCPARRDCAHLRAVRLVTVRGIGS
jgi:hypothetical protein